MTNPVVPDPSQQPITAADPMVARILALIQAKSGNVPPPDQTAAPLNAPIPQQPMQTAPVAPQPQLQAPAPPPPNVNELGAPLQPLNELGAALPTPQQAPVAPQPGPIKSFLQHLVSGLGDATYTGSQAALQHLGLPTDYEKQQNALKIGIQQQQADALTGLRGAQTSAAQSKADQLDQLTAPYTIDKDDPSVLPQFRGAATTFGGYQALQKLSGTTQGKTDVAQTQADSRERLANAQLAVREAIANRQYGLAAQRLSLAGGNQNLRQLEYRLRAYGTGADGQPLPGVEFSADGTPIGTATQANVRPTTNARNAGERGETMQDLATRIQGALNDPEIAQGLGPIMGRINDIKGQAGVLDGPLAELRNDLVSYGAFQSGLHPVRGIGALQYFDKVMGGLGQTPEELKGKLASNAGTVGSVINVAKGNRGALTPPSPQGVQALTDGGVTYQIPAALVPAFKKDHPNAR